MSQISTISYYTLLEARYTRLPLLLAAVLIVMLALSFFAAELAVIESTRVQVGFYAAGARLAGVFMLSAYVLSSISREFNDKGIDALLALDLPRKHYVLGKLGAFLVIAVFVALVASLPLALRTPAAALLSWGVAYALELAVIAAFSLFCVIAFGQFIPAAALVLGFYLLARTLTAIQLMSAHPISGAETLSRIVGRRLVDALTLVTPALDRWPQTAWLIDSAAPAPSFVIVFTQAVLYIVLLTGAAMVDFQRRNF